MICSVSSCDRPARSRGWCHQHYKRWRRTGDVQANKPFGVKTALPDTCIVVGCVRAASSRSMCALHYDRSRLGRDLCAELPHRYNGDRCSVDECGRDAKYRNMCQMHYRRHARTGSVGGAAPRLVNNVGKTCLCGLPAFVRGECRNCYRRRVYVESGDEARLLARAYRARKRSAVTIPFTSEQLAQRVTYYGDRCWLCGTPEWTDIDHVKPLAKGGPHMLSNLRPACASCNGAKSDKWPLTAVAA